MTRKRRCESLSAKPISSRCGPSTSQEFGILQAASQFLNFRDCAKVDQLNKLFHAKLWLHVLNSAARPRYAIISVNEHSGLWLEKFSSYLRNQSLILDLWGAKKDVNYTIFTNLTIPQLHSLRVFASDHRPITLPPKVHEIITTSFHDSITFGDVKDLVLTGPISSNLLRGVPTTVRKLTLYFPDLPCSTWPMLPNVTSLKLCCGRRRQHTRIDDLVPAFPSLVKLRLVQTENGTPFNLEPLRNARLLKLKIMCDMLVDLEPLCCVPLEELDVSDCPRVVDFSSVRHVPIIRKHCQ